MPHAADQPQNGLNRPRTQYGTVSCLCFAFSTAYRFSNSPPRNRRYSVGYKVSFVFRDNAPKDPQEEVRDAVGKALRDAIKSHAYVRAATFSGAWQSKLPISSVCIQSARSSCILKVDGCFKCWPGLSYTAVLSMLDFYKANKSVAFHICAHCCMHSCLPPLAHDVGMRD